VLTMATPLAKRIHRSLRREPSFRRKLMQY
jgi:hypothetical protein